MSDAQFYHSLSQCQECRWHHKDGKVQEISARLCCETRSRWGGPLPPSQSFPGIKIHPSYGNTTAYDCGALKVVTEAWALPGYPSVWTTEIYAGKKKLQIRDSRELKRPTRCRIPTGLGENSIPQRMRDEGLPGSGNYLNERRSIVLVVELAGADQSYHTHCTRIQEYLHHRDPVCGSQSRLQLLASLP